MIAKFQDFSSEGMKRRREWVVLSDTGNIGFYRVAKSRRTYLEWQGRWTALSWTEIRLLNFACCPAGGIRRWNLTFRCAPNGVWGEAVEVASRAFLPMFVVHGTALEVDPYVHQLDRWALNIGG